MSQVKEVIVQGLWKNNSALVQLLGMCPLLAVTSTATNAMGLGLATTLVLTLTNFSISALRRWTPSEIRIPIYVMIIASVVSVVQMLINARWTWTAWVTRLSINWSRKSTCIPLLTCSN
jgi:electron transport complex protein RnfE